MFRPASLAAAFTLAASAAAIAYDQAASAADRVAAGDPPHAGSSPSGTVPYCSDLKRIVVLALTKERFSTIIGSPREGSFFDTTLPLSGWKDCSLYGSRTYTCDSQDFVSVDQAMERQGNIVADIKGCLGDGWAEDPERASPTYTVLRSSRAPVSMTISTGPGDDDAHVVRLTLFPRTGN